jgi:S-phase kinase-associated protein 1
MATPAPAAAATAEKKEDKKEDKKEGEVGGLSLDDVTGTLKLVSKDKKEYDIERKHAFISTLVKTSLDTDASATEVPIPGVASGILTEVVAYMNHHKGVEPPIIEKPLRSKVMKDVCKDPFDADFIDRIGENRQALYDLILAANYMDIKSLLHLGCAKVASLIKGQPLEKIKDILSVSGGKTEEKKEEKAPAKEEPKKA